MSRLTGSLCRADDFIRHVETFISSCGDTRCTISHTFKTPGNCMHYGGPTQPAQHCATAQVPGNIG